MGSLKREHTIKQCRCVVMYEQNKQWNNENKNSAYEYEYDYDYYDPIQILANWSMKVTKESTRRARLDGMKDAQEASRLIGDSWVIHKSDNDNSTGAKEGNTEVHPRDASLKAGKSIISNNKEDTALAVSLKHYDSSTAITSSKKKIITEKKKNSKQIIVTTTNSEEEEGVVSTATTTTTIQFKKKKKNTKSSCKSHSTTKKSSSEDPPGSRLLIQEEE